MKLARSAVVFALGFFAIAAQTLLFRAYLTAFEGNELGVGSFFGSWLLWVAAGAFAGRGAARLASRVDLLSLLYPIAFALQWLLITNARALADIQSYELFPLGGMIALSMVTNAPVGFLTGFLFTLACRWWADAGGLPVARVYILETLGACAGGVAVTALLAGHAPGETVFFCISLVVAVAGGAHRIATERRGWRHWLALMPAGLAAASLAFGLDGILAERNCRAAWARLLPAEAYAGRFATSQARYLYGEREGQFVVMSAGGVCESLPDDAHAAEIIALNLAQHPSASRFLVVGPGSLAVCLRLLELPGTDQVVWLHPDPDYPTALRQALPEPDRDLLERLTVPEEDVRAYVRAAEPSFDLAILNLPDVTTLVLNRYCSHEFFGMLRGAMADGGVVSLRTSGAANFMAGELAYLGGSTLQTLASVFGQVVIKPGDETWFIASDTAALSESPPLLAERFAGIRGATQVYPPEAVAGLYPPDRIAFQREAYLKEAATVSAETLINTDARPAALLYSLLVVLRQAGVGQMTDRLPVLLNGGLWMGVAAVLIYALLRVAYMVNARGPLGQTPLFDAGFLVASMGGAGMALSIALMFLYQSHFGSLFLHIGLISAVFMLGVFAGGLASEQALLRRGREPRWAIPVCIAAHLALILLVATLPPSAPRLWFAALFVGCGVFTGLYFPIAAHRMSAAGRSTDRAGRDLEMFDHFGGAAGAVVTGLFLLPVLGGPGTLLLTALLVSSNLAPFASRHRFTMLSPGVDWFDRMVRPTGYAMLGVGAFAVAMMHIAGHFASAEEEHRFSDAAAAMAGDAELGKRHARLPNGATATYFALSSGEYVFGTAELAPDAVGYAGPVGLAARVGAEGELQDLEIIQSSETPAYLELVAPWMATLRGLSVFEPGALSGVDGVSGATLTCDAVLTALSRSGPAFAREALGMDVASQGPLREPRRFDKGFLWLAALMAGAILIRYRPNPWLRRGFLAASLVVGGFYLNLQYSTQQVMALLRFDVYLGRLDAALFLTVLVPVIVILFGNVYCGYVCPFGALQELLGDLRPRSIATDPEDRVWRYGKAVKYVLLLFLVLVFATTGDYTVLGADPLVTIFGAARDRAVTVLAGVVVALALVYRRFWCRNLCPAGAALALLNRLKVARRLMPTTRPGRCDLGVRAADELDCLCCDRCRHEEK
jgi:4Fe-4S binding domain/FMN-binding domain